jgi:hypothetical protein
MHPRYASAYLDPGTGSYILQIVVAAILGGLFMVKPFFAKIKHFFRKFFFRKHRDDQSAE